MPRPAAPLRRVHPAPDSGALLVMDASDYEPEGHAVPGSPRAPMDLALGANRSTSTPVDIGQRRRLSVQDAINYLEKVKYEFGNRSNVYNRFIEIMKEFKANTIDTLGVIVRVCQLFQGKDELAVGFNRFLPPGYEIRIAQDESEGNGNSVQVIVPANFNLTPIAPSSHQQQNPGTPSPTTPTGPADSNMPQQN